MTERKEHAPGIYFGLEDAIYHADPAIGSTGMKQLANDPTDFWHNSHMNEMNAAKEEKDDTAARIKGRALHTMTFDGQDHFERQFIVEPSKDDYDNLLLTNDDLQEHLESECGVEIKGKPKKADLIKLMNEHAPNVPIWSEIEREFADLCAETKRSRISSDTYLQIRYASAMIAKNPNLTEAFGNGRSEVSVFWKEEGLRMKARFDYLKANAIVDLKSISIGNRMITFNRACLMAVANYRYDIQAAHYMDGRHHARQFIHDGKVFGENPPSQKWLDHIAKIKRYAFLFIFHRVDGAPVSHGVQIDPGSAWHLAGRSCKRTALDNYHEYFKRYGTDTWFHDAPIHHLDDQEIPGWMGL